MKKIIFILVALAFFQNWDSVTAYLDPPPNYGALHSEQVVLYSTDWCGYCRKARALMEANNISYFEYDIEKSEEGKKQYDHLGGKGVPVMLIDGEVVFGYDQQKILKL